MEQRPPADGTFELVPSSTPGVFDFKVAVNYGTPKPGNAIAAGTAYSAITAEQMPNRPFVDLWSDYVAAQREPAGTLVFWQYFVASLPTTPTVAEDVNELWGKVRIHTYLDLITNTRPDRGEMFASSSSTLTTSAGVAVTLSDGTTPVTVTGDRRILDIKEEDLGQGLCRVKVITVDNSTVTTTDQVLDDASGRLLDVMKVWTLAETQPIGAAVNSLGFFTEVQRMEHRIWQSITRKVSGLPMSRAEAITWDTQGSIYWPAVLNGYTTTQVTDSEGRWSTMLAYSMREPHAGQVKVTKRRWQELTPPTVVSPVNLIPTAISIRSRASSISLPECLHQTFSFEEFQYVVYLAGRFNYSQMAVWSVSPTTYTDWPETLVRLDVNYNNGVFICEESTYHRPEEFTTNNLTIGYRDAVDQDYLTAPL